MQRYFLAKGDRAGGAVIVEGLPTSTYQGADGVRVELSTVYMKTWCDACKGRLHLATWPAPCGHRRERPAARTLG